jgi:DNA gyrase/topoisomerase IV subunit B
MRLRVFRDGAEWAQMYECGIPTSSLASIGRSSEQGTEFTFALDGTILRIVEFTFDELTAWVETNIRRMAIVIQDERSGRDVEIPAKAG